MGSEFECCEKYRWDNDLGDYVLVVRVKQRDGCRLLRTASRYKRNPDRQLTCPVLTGELVDCQECQWHDRENA